MNRENTSNLLISISVLLLAGQSYFATVAGGNDFSSDPNCVALWSLEDGVLTTDSIGSNTLTNNGVTSDTSNYQEGAAAGDFVRSSSDYLYRADTNLSGDFPGKSGSGNDTFSFCAWFRCTSLPTGSELQSIVSKYEWAGDERGFYVSIGVNESTTTVCVSLAYDGGASRDKYWFDTAIVANRWYHVGVVVDGSNVKIRIWDDTAGALLGGDEEVQSQLHDMYCPNAQFRIGAVQHSTWPDHFNGQIDEVVLFGDSLSSGEIDQVRAGSYGSSSGGGVPNPDPMEWATVPHAISSSAINMMAAEAQDPNGTVQYYFQNVTVGDGSHDSGWQSGRTYTDTSLTADTVYEYKVKARSSSGGPETAYSVQMSARTEPSASTTTPEGSAEPVSGELGNALNLQVDPFTGSVSYTLPISLPPGRQGSEPSLALRYGGGGNGWCGVGWSLGMGAIQRDSRRGVPVARDQSGQFDHYYDDDRGFVVAFGAVNSRLVEVNDVTSEYRAETDQAFLKYQFDRTNNQWIVTDKSGNKFHFGEVAGEYQGDTAGATMVHPQFDSATDSDNTFLWGLAKIQDINGNLTYVYYTEDANQLYLDEIRYNGHTEGLPTTSSVRFALDDPNDPNDTRRDKSFSYATGYRVENNRLLNDIAVWVYDYDQSDWTRVRRYHLDYEDSPSTLRSLLNSVTVYGASDANSLHPVTFSYQVKPFEFEETTDWGALDSQYATAAENSPVSTGIQVWQDVHWLPVYPPDYEQVFVWQDQTSVALMDLDGDSLPDRVMRNTSGYAPPNNVFKIQLNTGTGFTELLDWGPLDAQGKTTGAESHMWNSPRGSRDDVLVGQDIPHFEYYDGELHEWWEYQCVRAEDVAVDMADINGDGLADRIMRRAGTAGYTSFAPPNNVFKVQYNTGSGFSNAVDWGPLYAYGYTTGDRWYDNRARIWNSTSATIPTDCPIIAVFLADMNHDGLLDRVLNNATGPFKVQLNSGDGFEHDEGTPIVVSWGPVSGQGSTDQTWVSARVMDASDETIVDFVDINGDGLPDRVMRKRTTPFDCFVVQFNTGYGFEKHAAGNPVLMDWEPVDGQGDATTTWNSLQGVDRSTGTLFVDFFDINGDGLPDRVMRERTTDQGGESSAYDVLKVQLNTGHGFQKDESGAAVLVNWTGIDDQDAGTVDWASPHAVVRPGYSDGDTYVTMCDINGDGLPDRVMRKKDADFDVFKVQLNKGPFPDLLSKVTGQLGGSVQVEYSSAVDPNRHKDSKGVNRLPFPVQVASLVRVDDGFGNEILTEYDYSRGFYDADRKEFSGFGLTTIKEVKEGPSSLEDAGTTTMMYFHQGGGYEDPNAGEFQDANSVAKKGMPYRVEVYGSDSNMYTVTVNKVEEAEIESGTDWMFAYVSQTTKLEYAGAGYEPAGPNYPSEYRAKVRRSEYDIAGQTGNILKSIDLGEVDLGSDPNDIAANIAGHTYTTNTTTDDDLYIHTSYETFANPEILNKIASTKTTSDSVGNTKLKEIVFTYDTKGRVVTEKTWLDKDKHGAEDRYTSTSQYAYDSYGNCDRSIDKAGVQTDTTFDSNYHMYPVEKDTEGFVTSTEYEIRSGLPVQTVDPAGMVSESVYDEFFRFTDAFASIEPNGTADLWQTHIEYNLGGIDANGISHNYVYQVHEGYEAYTYRDGLGRIAQVRTRAEITAPNDYRVVHTTYDECGRLSYVTRPYFDDDVVYRSGASQPGTLTEYDAVGRIWRVTPPDGDTGSPTGPSTTAYSDNGDPWAEVSTDAEGKVTKRYFDAAGRVIRVVEEVTGDPNVVTEFEYDRLGRLITTIDDDDNEFEVEYDSLGRKIRSIDPDMGTWTYTYDDDGRMTEQVDGRGNKVQFTYNDDLGRVSQKTIRNSSNTVVETITYTYDQSDDAEYTVHKGQLYKVTDGEGWTKTGYDARGRAIKSTRYVTETDEEYTTQTGYDIADRVTQIAYPNNQAVIAYSYDEVSHLVKVESLWGTGADEVFYEASGFNEIHQETRIDYGNGLATEYEYYDQTRRLKRMVTLGDPNVQGISYTYDKASNIKSVTDGAHTGVTSCGLSSIQYDDLHRLVSLYSAGESTTYTYEYDALGNVHKNGEMGTGSYTYSATQPHAVVSANGNSYAYDACGNMTTRNSSEYGNQTLTYDEQNRLVQVAISGGSTVQFGYSAGGSRLWKKVGGQVTGLWIGSIYEEKDGKVLCHVYAGDRLVASFEPERALACIIQNNRYLAAIYNNGSEALMAVFGHGRAPLGGMGLAIVIGLACGIVYSRKRLWQVHGLSSPAAPRLFFRQLLLMCLVGSIVLSGIPQAAYATPTYDPVFYYYHPDHLGSAQIMTDRAGEIVQHYGYHTYGSERYRDNISAFSVSNRYTGQTLDEDTGLYYYGARYYDPELARFIQADSTVPDPEFSQAYNRYAYVYNNPLKFTDPAGQRPFWTVAAGAFAGAYMGAMQAAWAGGNTVMGAYVGLVNGVASTSVIPTVNGASTALTSALTRNTSSSGFTSEWNVSTWSYNDTREPETAPDWLSTSYDPDWSPVTYDYGRGSNPTRQDLRYALNEAGHSTLEVVGVFDPTPIADSINAAWYAREGRRGAAIVSAMAMIPYIGDLGKGARYSAKALRHGDDVAALARGARRVVDKPWKSVIEGTAHGSGAHMIRTYREAVTMAKSGKYERIYLNRSLRKATSGQVDSLMRPDVTGALTTGRIDMVEVVSPSQTRRSQIDKVTHMLDLLGPQAGRGNVIKPH